MIWDFEDGVKYESAYSVDDIDYASVDEIAKVIETVLPNVNTLKRDPILDYERIHRRAASQLRATERAKAAFLDSALERISKMGNGILLTLQTHDLEYRIVLTRSYVSILKPVGTDDVVPAEIAREISNVLDGTVHKLIY